jgi:cobyrinic acid a,c-diamide synthase
MNSKPVGRGYVELVQHLRHPWPMESDIIRAHEFHYSKITLNKKINSFAYKVKRGYGINGKYDGVLYKNLLATYSHLRDTNQSMWIKNYLQFIKNNKKS